MIITLISDTHNKHDLVTNDLPGGDLLIHAGDMTSMGKKQEVSNFLNWFDSIKNYKNKVFIAGNHDFLFQENKEVSNSLLKDLDIKYLEDELFNINDVNIYGSPWQPEFHNWSFNLPRNGKEIKQKWNNIPTDTDILVTHGPPFGYLDKVLGVTDNLGCEALCDIVKTIKPKIHVFGHIHDGYGYTYNGDTHFINASVLAENYSYSNKPLTIDWNKETNDLIFK